MYYLTDTDREILYYGQQDANLITNYYLRSKSSGTWWNPDTDDIEKKDGYWKLHNLWRQAGRPSKKLVIDSDNGTVEYLVKGPTQDGHPIFHHNHGFLFMPWQLDVHHAKEHTRIVAGGYGTGKTQCLAVSMAIYAILNREFAGAIVAPYSIQSTEAFNKLNATMRGTPFFSKFVAKVIQRPIPTITFEHDAIGQSTIRFIPVLDDAAKMKTLELDAGYVDQAEMFPDLNRDIFEVLGSRVRGQVAGRERLGILGLFANSEDNPEFWDAYDDAEFDSDTMAMTVSTYDNPFLTSGDKRRMEQRVGGTEDAISVKMRGQRPRGQGKHFNSEMLEKCRNKNLEIVCHEGVGKNLPDYRYDDAAKVGVWRWEIPAKINARHLVVADPGTDNPPFRNSAVIMAWDITQFPKKPASLRYFHWVFGHGSPTNFLNDYMSTVQHFNADSGLFQVSEYAKQKQLQPGENAFDATGLQKMYDDFIFKEYGLAPDQLRMNGDMKYGAINAAKIFMANGLFEWPYIPHLWLQMLKYDLPDNKLRQDLVMTVCMSALWLLDAYRTQLESVTGDGEDYRKANRNMRSNIARYRRYTERTRYERAMAAAETRTPHVEVSLSNRDSDF